MVEAGPETGVVRGTARGTPARGRPPGGWKASYFGLVLLPEIRGPQHLLFPAFLYVFLDGIKEDYAKDPPFTIY